MTETKNARSAGARLTPSVDDEVAASLRALAFRIMSERHSGEPTTWPASAREQYQLLMSQQTDYEAMFVPENAKR